MLHLKVEGFIGAAITFFVPFLDWRGGGSVHEKLRWRRWRCYCVVVVVVVVVDVVIVDDGDYYDDEVGDHDVVVDDDDDDVDDDDNIFLGVGWKFRFKNGVLMFWDACLIFKH